MSTLLQVNLRFRRMNHNSAGYIAPGRVETLDHNIRYEYNYVLVLGTLQEIRSYVYEHAGKSRSTLPDHSFENDREHWHYENARDGGWPIHGELRVFLEQTDPQIIGPSGFWRAKDAPRLSIRAACKTSDTHAQLYSRKPVRIFGRETQK